MWTKARTFWSWAANTRAVAFISNDKGSIRTWLAVSGTAIAVPVFFYNQFGTKNALDKIATISDQSSLQLKRMTEIAEATQGIAKTSERWASLSAQMLMDAQVTKFDALQARMDPSWVPTSAEEQRELIEYMSWAVTLAHSVDLYTTALVVEKYGFRIEYLLANVFVQDQLLCNSARWASLIKLGKSVTLQPAPDGTPPYLSRPARLEAMAFITAFDKEAPDCHARVENILRARAMDARAVRSADPYNFKCTYTRERVAELVASAAAAGDAPPKSDLR